MSSWASSEKCFELHHNYLDEIKKGAVFFEHEKPGSLARIIRGMLQRVRETQDERYLSIANYMVSVGTSSVSIIAKSPSVSIDKIHTNLSFNEVALIVNRMKKSYGHCTYLFIGTTLSDENRASLESLCKEFKFVLEIEPTYIKVAKQ